MPIQSSFNAGEISPRTFGRVDIDKYESAVQQLQNMMAMPQGPAIRRSGTRFMGETKTSTKESRLLKFEYNVETAYIIELGHEYMRFYTPDGQILGGQSIANGSFEYETTPPTPDNWTTVNSPTSWEVDSTRWIMPEKSGKLVTTAGGAGGIKSNTFATVTDKEYFYRIFVYTSTASVYVTLVIRRGDNGGDIVSRNVALTQNEWTEISGIYVESNGGTGAYMQITQTMPTSTATIWFDNAQHGPTDQVCEIVSPYSSDEIWDVYLTQTNDIAYLFHPRYPIRKLVRFASDWWDLLTPTIANQPSRWNASAGYPACGTFHQQRLWCGGVPSYPQYMWGSRVGAFEDFDLGGSSPDDTHALELELSSASANVVRWMTASRKLNVGTTGGEWWIGATASETITPADKTAHLDSVHGSAPIKPVLLGNTVLFVQRPGKILRELSYSYTEDSYEAISHFVLAEHLTKKNYLIDLDRAFNPHSAIYTVRNDGVLLAMTYMKQEEVYGWQRYIVGGVSDATGAHADVESVRAIPSVEDDEVWVIVRRRINNVVKRYVERLEPFFKEESSTDDAWFVDSGILLDNRAKILAVQEGTPTLEIEIEEDYIATDDFSNGFKDYWVNGVGAHQPMQTGSGVAYGTTGAGRSMAYYRGDFSDDQFAEGKLIGTAASGFYSSLMLQCNAAGTSYYELRRYEAGGSVTLYKNGSTFLASGGTTIGDADVIRLECTNVTDGVAYMGLRVYVNGVYLFQYQDYSPLTGGQPGVTAGSNSSSQAIDDFRCGRRCLGLQAEMEVRIRCVGLEHATDPNLDYDYRPVKVFQTDVNVVMVYSLEDENLDLTDYSAFVSGTLAELVTSVSGLDHLEGEEVQVFTDGGVDSPKTVSSGAITLTNPGSVVLVGLKYESILKTLPPSVLDDKEIEQGEIKRYTHVKLRLDATIGSAVGADLDRLDTIQMTSDEVPLGQPPALFSGLTEWYGLEGGYEESPAIIVYQDEPYPLTIVAIMSRLEAL